MKEKTRKVTVPPTTPETRIITRATIRLGMNASFCRDAPGDTGLTPECILLSDYISVVRKLSIAKIFQKSQFETIASTPLLTVGSAI